MDAVPFAVHRNVQGKALAQEVIAFGLLTPFGVMLAAGSANIEELYRTEVRSISETIAGFYYNESCRLIDFHERYSGKIHGIKFVNNGILILIKSSIWETKLFSPRKNQLKVFCSSYVIYSLE